MVDPLNFFQVGATLSADSPSYIERPADAQLISALVRGELCLVLAPRQTGKSSLMVHARQGLVERGMRSGTVDLQRLGKEADPDRFFNSVMRQLRRSLGLKVEVYEWTKSHEGLSPTERFALFVEEVVLAKCEGGVVLFFDEIDSILNLPFSDDFFTTIRSLHNGRATDTELRRLRFVLLGTATKSAFIKDRSRTPFNVGTEITLTDFDRADTDPFKRVLGDDSGQFIERIFHWTSGQPLLVQKLASAAYSWPPEERTPTRLDREVDWSLFKQKVEQDTHLKFIRDYLLGEPALLRRTLSIYADVLEGLEVAESNQSPAQDRLKLAGVVRVERGRLGARNRIYSRIFDQQWIKENKPVSFTDWPFKYQATVVTASIIMLVASWFMLRPYFYLHMPSIEREIYYQETVAELTFDALDATRASLTPGKATIEGGHLRLHLESLRPGESKYTLVVEGDCLFKRLCLGEARKEVEFTLSYYPGGEILQFPNPALESIDPLLELNNGSLLLKDASDGSILWDGEGDRNTTAAVLSPDRNRLLVGSRDGTVNLWFITRTAVETGSSRMQLTRLFSNEKVRDHSPVRSLAFGPDVSTFFAGHDDGELWRGIIGNGLDTMDSMHLYLSLDAPINNVVYGLGGFVLSTQGTPPRYYDEQRPEESRVFKGHSGIVSCIASSLDGTMLVTGNNDGKIMLWNIATGELMQTLTHGAHVDAVAFSRDGKHVLSGGGGGLKLWEVASGNRENIFASRINRPDQVDFSLDGRTIFSHQNDALQVWNLETKSEIPTFTGHHGKVIAVAFSLDGQWIASADDANTIKVWNTITAELKSTLTYSATGVSGLEFAPNGRTLIASHGSIVVMWDVENGTVLDTINVGDSISHLALQPAKTSIDSKTNKLITLAQPFVGVSSNNGENGKIDIIEMILPDETDVNRIQSAVSSDRQDKPEASVKHFRLLRTVFFPARVNAVALSHGDNNLAAAALANGMIELFNVVTGEKSHKITVQTGRPVYAVAFSPDGKLLASDNTYRELIILDVNTGGLVRSLAREHKDRLNAIAFSPDGETLVSGSSDMTVRLWDVESGKVFRTFARHTGKVTDVVFSSDGNRVVSSSEDHTVKLWWAKRPDTEARRKRREAEQLPATVTVHP